MNEKRHHKRFVVEGMDISGNMMFATEVSVQNISISGMSVKADRRLDIGKEYTIKLHGHKKVVAVKGLVVWSSLVGTRMGHGGEAVPVYSAGMRFTDVLSERIRDIIGFIEGSEHGDEQRITGLRFSISNTRSAVLHFPSRYAVKKISAGGMLIESSEALEVDEMFPMELSIPEETPIHFTGRVASCAASGAGGIEHFEIGIEFADMGDAGRSKLQDFITMLKSIGGGL